MAPFTLTITSLVNQYATFWQISHVVGHSRFKCHMAASKSTRAIQANSPTLLCFFENATYGLTHLNAPSKLAPRPRVKFQTGSRVRDLALRSRAVFYVTM